MKKPDLSGLSLEELQAVIDEAKQLAETKRIDSLTELVKGWIEQAEADGFSVKDVISAISALVPAAQAEKTRAPRGSVVKEPKPYVKGVVYKNPQGDETWVGGTIGRQPPWLRELVPATLSLEERTRKFASLAVKQK